MKDRIYQIILTTATVIMLVILILEVYKIVQTYHATEVLLSHAIKPLVDDLAENAEILINEYYFVFDTIGKSPPISMDSLWARLDSTFENITGVPDSRNVLKPYSILQFCIMSGKNYDSLVKTFQSDCRLSSIRTTQIPTAMGQGNHITAMCKYESFIIMRLKENLIEPDKLKVLFQKKLTEHGIKIEFELRLGNIDPDNTFYTPNRNYYQNRLPKSNFDHLIISEKSLKSTQRIAIEYNIPTLAIWSYMAYHVFASIFLILFFAGFISYLIYKIKMQKQLAEIKNDLISNITHEFKTPIATAFAAVESMKTFGALEDKEKSEAYLDTTQQQLGKLSNMVEKLLETATLDGGKIELEKEPVDLNDLLRKKVLQYAENFPEKDISFQRQNQKEWVLVDSFHFDNVLENLLDNAMKYGGNKVEVTLKNVNSQIVINVKDSGATLTRSQKNIIFDKFYRVPKGNIHDVKGFGIGLYYTRQIVEKHGGTIGVDIQNDGTTFKITLPNG